MASKINLNEELVKKSREHAKNIASKTQEFIDKHTTVSVERTICRLLGIDGVNEVGVPFPNIVVDHLVNKGVLANGASYFIGNAMVNLNLEPMEIANKIYNESLDITKLENKDIFDVKIALLDIAEKTVDKIRSNRKKRDEFLNDFGDKKGPYIYVIVATGNIYEDITQAIAAAKQGADVIAVIRTTGQSLLDYVPYGATKEGFGGTYATQENFKLMRKALDEVCTQEKRYIRLCNYCSGLCMPEIAAMGALERLDVMLNDALYGILFRDINMKRTLIDQFFSRVINGFAGIIINTGEDNYLTTQDAVEEAYTVLASQFINEQFALIANIPENQMGLGHAFEIDPDFKNGFLFEIAQAQMVREIFPNAPLKYMPPTKFKTGNIFKSHVQDTLFNVATMLTNQKIHLLGMLTEAIHTPFMSDRALSIENAKYVFNTMEGLSEEISFKEGGIIQKRAKDVLLKTSDLLENIEAIGLFKALENGIFAGIKRSQSLGKGLSGVYEKSNDYFNPFMDLMLGGEINGK